LSGSRRDRKAEMSGSTKGEIITFKVDDALARELEAVGNRSEFIRQAVLAALDNSCPLCGGTGVLSASGRRHWDEFVHSHHVEQCNVCHERHLVCDAGEHIHDTEDPHGTGMVMEGHSP
jgi:hypothetical protein